MRSSAPLLPAFFLRRLLFAFVMGLTLLGTLAARTHAANAPTPQPGADILADLRALQHLGGVLYIAAHPDDENTQLLTYFARGRSYRTAYLSLTRGDGGQNVLSADFGERLGVARTQELLAARRLDGGEQYFTRALDFGFSKDYQETLRVWDGEQVFADVVRVIRQFRPDVIVTRFSPTPGGTHGHHTASAVLAVDAFRAAADPTAFPDQLTTLKPWQVKRVFWNVWRGGGDGPEILRLDVQGEDIVSGLSFPELAGRSRAQHKTQGFDSFAIASGPGPRMESFQLIAGEPAQGDIMDGIDPTWARVEGGAEINREVAALLASFDGARPEASVPALLSLRRKLAVLPADHVFDGKRQLLDSILQRCLGLEAVTRSPRAEVVTGAPVVLRHSLSGRAGVSATWTAIRYPSLRRSLPVVGGGAVSATARVVEDTVTLPAETPLTQPYWLRREPVAGLFQVEDPDLIGRAENPPSLPVEYVVEIGGQELVVATEPLLDGSASLAWEQKRALAVVAPVSLRFAGEVELFAPGSSRDVQVDVTAAGAPVEGTVRLEAADGWQVSDPQPFQIATQGGLARLSFQVTAPAGPAVGSLGVVASVQGREYRVGRVEVAYKHVPVQLLQPVAKLRLVSLALEKKGQRVGYLPGAGDTVADSLARMGYAVTLLTGSDLVPEKLAGLDAVVIGVRAFNVRTDLNDRMPALFAYADGGGTVVMQYNNPGGLKVQQFSPQLLRLGPARVTDETAAVTPLVPAHPALNRPNRLTPADFEGWVQERGLYFAAEWDSAYTPLLAMADPGEGTQQGALLVARHGRGHIVYTGLSFFRQLPAGVPGAFRLFANLVSLGHE